MTDLTIYHQTDTFHTRNTGQSHGTDAFKVKVTPTAHTTDANLVPPGLRTHSTDAILRGPMMATHNADASKWTKEASTASATQPIGTVLAETADSTTGAIEPELSKNSSTYLEIGSGLSVLVGLPRIPTWNTPGRPKKPKAGTYGLNSQTHSLEYWDGNTWFITPMDRQ